MIKAAETSAGGGERPRKKLTLGRQKIEIKRITSEEARQVCFSKRRVGLFKKANELSVLCGAHVAVVVFSPAGRPFSFGHPSVPAVLDVFLSPSAAATLPPPHSPAAVAAAGAHPAVVYEFDHQVNDLNKALDAARRRKEVLEETVRAAGAWTLSEVQRKGLPELESMLAALERVQAEAAERAKAIISEEAAHCAVGSTGLVHYFGVDGGDGFGEEVMDRRMAVVGGDAGHGHGLAPLASYAPLLPPPPMPPFSHGFGFNPNDGYGFGLDGNGNDHGVYEVDGFYGHTGNFLW